MKKIYLTLFAFIAIVLTTNVNAQTNVTSSGMSIQGIARDETNAAIANIDQLALVFTVYYLGTGNSEQTILTKTANVKTDNFGVFSYVLDIDQLQYNQINTQSAYLKVVQGSVVFSNEKLQAVPYAIFAQNGVPTGSIMPFIGTVAPNGWLLCNGSTFADNANTANLKALLGSTTTPNLNGMFLRGTGTAASGKVGPALKAVQQDDLGQHLHSVNLTTSTNGLHDHSNNSDYNRALKYDGAATANSTDTSNNTTEPNLYSSKQIVGDGNHNHSVSGSTGNTGITETRPINYGVNYIIKI
ncbi:tail fiber protein [Flavobacterium sp. Arc2]|uniref:tail fiber protein n=1 Tax=Flavobacterium sp. Arc2 TaxID=3046685 RepID=UPI00352C8F22